MKRMMLATGLVATAGWLMLAQATAQQPPRPAAPPPTPGPGQFPGATATLDQQRGAAVPMNPKNDQEFIEWAATRNAMEVELGNMAARKAPASKSGSSLSRWPRTTVETTPRRLLSPDR